MSVSTECGQESQTGDGHGQSRGTPIDAASFAALPLTRPQPVPSQHSQHRHQHRSPFIHPVRAPSQTGERAGLGRTRKDRAYQIVPALGLLLLLPRKEETDLDKKNAVKKESEGRKRVQRSWGSNCSQSQSLQGQWVSMAPEGETGGGDNFLKITLMPFCHRASLLSTRTRT